ncbi:MAG TPA: FkbM family methyltransferase [Polyangiaceae bacterium]|nr:FkbM family methyltransferase [Polyangiaceae bacterium]
MKALLRKALRRVGFDIVRYTPAQTTLRSERTSALTRFETKTGNYYLPTDAHGDVVANAIKAGKIFEPEVVNLALSQIRPGSVVLDVGANFGQMSVLFAQHAGPQGKVYAFEADDFVFEIFKRNIDANSLNGRIEPVFGAVHDVAGETLYFPVQDFKRWSSYGSYGVDYNAAAGRAVRTLTIDSLEINEPVSFMKIDIQGGDLQAMKGAKRTIEHHRMPIIFEYEYHFEDEYKLSFQEYVDFVQSIDYRFQKVVSGHNFLIVPRERPLT